MTLTPLMWSLFAAFVFVALFVDFMRRRGAYPFHAKKRAATDDRPPSG